jgi:hypothetical protein
MSALFSFPGQGGIIYAQEWLKSLYPGITLDSPSKTVTWKKLKIRSKKPMKMVNGINKMNAVMVLLLLSLLSLVLPIRALDAFAGETPEPGRKTHHRIPKLDKGIKVDGVLDDETWQQALKLELRYETWPGENLPALARTEVFIYHTKTYFYFGVHAYDPDPSAIRAFYSDRDTIWNDDWIAITMDTFMDPRRRFSFFCNALGVQADLIETIDENLIFWDSIWDSAGRIGDDGYIVEMAIPFSSLRFQRTKEEQTWRIDIVRMYPRDVKHYFTLITRDRNNPCHMCQADHLTGFKGAKPGKNLEFDPAITAIYTQERESFPDGKFVKKESKLNPGITASWGFTPNMTLSAAINPDFSNVETDAAQLDINTQFALYYPEQRPFFLENAAIFQTPYQVVYTRALADPDWGIKLTGKEGRHTLGFYSVQDKMTNLLLPATLGTGFAFLDKKSVGSVLRYGLDLGKSSTLGLTLTDREGTDYYNRLAGIDGDIWLSLSDKVQFQFLHTQTRYPDQVATQYNQPAGKFSGNAAIVNYKHTSRNLEFFTGFQQIDPEFRADLGFITQAGYRNYNGGFYYSWLHSPGHWYTLLKVGPSFQYETDVHDNLVFKAFQFTTVYNGPAQTDITLIGTIGKRFFWGEIFDTNNVLLVINMFPTSAFQMSFLGVVGDQIDFDNARQGRRIMLNPAVKYKFGRHFAMTLSHIFERFNIDAGRLYTANVSNFRMVYQFNRRAFLRVLLRYIDYRYNSDLYLYPQDPEFKHLISQVLFSYKVNPRTVLFLGYSDDYYGSYQVRLKQNNRTFFMKIGYALVL